jgi:hypothetical protein
MAAAEMDLLDPEPASNTNSPSETRPRKRRRRTVACTQCRTRKLKCDREYPACSRCLKSGIPDRCKYEDSFVWQQPNTVTASTATATATTTTTPPNGGVAGIDRLSSSHITLPPPSRVAAGASPRFATVLPAYPKSTAAAPPAPLPLPASQSQPSSRINSVSGSNFRQPGTSRARFLDTVLDGPNPPANSTWRPDGDAAQPGHAGGYQHALATPSQRLELPNKVMIRGKETRTRFNGGGIMSNLMLQVCN